MDHTFRTVLSRTMIGLAMLSASCLAFVAPASAQTGYPPGGCTATAENQSAGTHAVGETFVIQLAPTCPFTPGGTVAVSVNGQSVGTKPANASGFVAVSITVQSATQLVVDDPVNVAGRCGSNTAVATGPSSVAGKPVTLTATFTLNCAAAAAAQPVPSGTVARTGANVARSTGVALLLVMSGALLVVLVRRRSPAPLAGSR